MNLKELKHSIHKWTRYYQDRNIPLDKINVIVTIKKPDSDELIEIENKEVKHGWYEARKPDEELVGGYKGKIYYISLIEFGEDNGMEEPSNELIKE